MELAEEVAASRLAAAWKADPLPPAEPTPGAPRAGAPRAISSAAARPALVALKADPFLDGVADELARPHLTGVRLAERVAQEAFIRPRREPERDEVDTDGVGQEVL